ncbi:MAG TPA: ABC transporter transmembrane domain-containing protein, partial [Egibacteraceae bacterium]
MGMHPVMGGGRGMLPGTGLVRRGQELPEGKKLPKGLVGRVWREFARPYRLRLFLLLGAIAATSVLTVLPARLIEVIVDAISQPAPGAATAINLAALGLIGVALAAGGFSLWQRYLSAWIGEELIFDLRRALFDHVQR